MPYAGGVPVGLLLRDRKDNGQNLITLFLYGTDLAGYRNAGGMSGGEKTRYSTTIRIKTRDSLVPGATKPATRVIQAVLQSSN